MFLISIKKPHDIYILNSTEIQTWINNIYTEPTLNIARLYIQAGNIPGEKKWLLHHITDVQIDFYLYFI